MKSVRTASGKWLSGRVHKNSMRRIQALAHKLHQWGECGRKSNDVSQPEMSLKKFCYFVCEQILDTEQKKNLVKKLVASQSLSPGKIVILCFNQHFSPSPTNQSIHVVNEGNNLNHTIERVSPKETVARTVCHEID
jgi:hypothetical protein